MLVHTLLCKYINMEVLDNVPTLTSSELSKFWGKLSKVSLLKYVYIIKFGCYVIYSHL